MDWCFGWRRGLVVFVAINFGGNAEPYDGYIAAGDNAYEISEFAEAAQHFRAAVAEAEKLGADTSQLSYALNGLGMTLRAQGQYAAALEIFRRNVLIKEGSLGPDHPELATSLSNAADSLQSLGRYDEAEPLYLRALAILEVELVPDDPGGILEVELVPDDCGRSEQSR